MHEILFVEEGQAGSKVGAHRMFEGRIEVELVVLKNVTQHAFDVALRHQVRDVIESVDAVERDDVQVMHTAHAQKRTLRHSAQARRAQRRPTQ